MTSLSKWNKERFEKPIELGSVGSGSKLKFGRSERSTHTLIAGRTGCGKSRQIISMIMQLLLKGEGVFVVDLHGDLSAHLEKEIALKRTVLNLEKIHIIDCDDPDSCFAFDPLAVDNPAQIASMAETFASTMATIFGDGDPRSTPLLTSVFFSIAAVLAEHGLALTEAPYFLLRAERKVREEITEGTANDYLRAFWRNLNSARPQEYMETMGSSERRLRSFFANDICRNMFGQKDNAVDIRALMDNRESLILNLSSQSGALPYSSRKAIGSLLVSTIVERAQTRGPNPATASTIFIDEAENFINHDIARTLDELRKFGAHMVLSVQTTEQIRLQDERVYASVMENASTKILFGTNSYEQAKAMAWEIFGDLVNPDRVKTILSKPTVVGYQRTVLRSGSETQSEADTITQGEMDSLATGQMITRANLSSRGSGSGESVSGSEQSGSGSGLGRSAMMPNPDAQMMPMIIPYIPNEFNESKNENSHQATSRARAASTNQFEVLGESMAEGSSEMIGHALSQSKGLTTGRSKASGFSETLEAILKVLPTATYSMDEQIHIYAIALRRLPKRHAFVKMPTRDPIEIRAHDVPDPILGQTKLQNTLTSIKTSTPFLTPRQKAVEEINFRQAGLAHLADEPADFTQSTEDLFLED